MIIVGLTGSIGMGKSTVATILADFGIPVFDADAVVHALQGSGGRLVPAIENAFPGSIRDGAVDRTFLGACVFGNDANLAKLEAIVHPAVAAERAAFMAAHRDAPIVVFDIPLLFEKHGEGAVDIVIVVSAPATVQRARVLSRSGMTPEKLDAILLRQLPDAQKRARADFVIDTDVPLPETRARVAEVVACLSQNKGG
jgi:dephospho-CoA kinase